MVLLELPSAAGLSRLRNKILKSVWGKDVGCRAIKSCREHKISSRDHNTLK